jgi:hypothetical protein
MKIQNKNFHIVVNILRSLLNLCDIERRQRVEYHHRVVLVLLQSPDVCVIQPPRSRQSKNLTMNKLRLLADIIQKNTHLGYQ